MKKAIFCIFVLFVVWFLYPKDKNIVGNNVNNENVVIAEEQHIEDKTQEVTEDKETYSKVINKESDLGNKLTPENSRRFNIVFEASVFLENTEKLLEDLNELKHENTGHYSGVKSNYAPSDLFESIVKEDTSLIIKTETIDAFGTSYSFDSDMCFLVDTKDSTYEDEEYISNSIIILCEDDSFRFDVLIDKKEYIDSDKETEYEMRTYLIDKYIEENSHYSMPPESLNIGHFPIGDKHGLIIH